MFSHHHATGFTTVPNIAGGTGSLECFPPSAARRGKNLLFLHQVDSQLFGKRGKDCLHLEKFRMVLADSDHLVGQRLNAALFTHKDMVSTVICG